ncbi:MAG: hypothetical protein A2284_10850 [Deltaproteobacteria bacterium RIFOXYA12_FULL_61_11]|nr:MAG: hypothetical protein A2284_10850 [Deltaproteobacteria bacterium RIFOXYA12_FULL_61_11]
MHASTPEALVEIQDLWFRYHHEWVLRELELTVQVGDFIGIVGPNGGGKTTFLRLLLGFLRPDRGSIRYRGRRLDRLGRLRIGYVPQGLELDPTFPVTVTEVVGMGLLHRLGARLWRSRQENAAVEAALLRLDLGDYAGYRFGDLSGGLKQRALLARALVHEPELLVLDEPTANVDPPTQQRIHDLLSELNERTTILMVSHNQDFITAHVNRVACINGTLAIHQAGRITDQTLLHRYGPTTLRVDHSSNCCTGEGDE